jgi:hypothetical protein
VRSRVGKLARAANGTGALLDDLEDRLEHERVQQERAQQEKADDPNGRYVGC